MQVLRARQQDEESDCFACIFGHWEACPCSRGGYQWRQWYRGRSTACWGDLLDPQGNQGGGQPENGQTGCSAEWLLQTGQRHDCRFHQRFLATLGQNRSGGQARMTTGAAKQGLRWTLTGATGSVAPFK